MKGGKYIALFSQHLYQADPDTLTASDMHGAHTL